MNLLAVPKAFDNLDCVSVLGHPLLVAVPPRYVTCVAEAIGLPFLKVMLGVQFIEMWKHLSMFSVMLYSADIHSIECTRAFIDF